MTLRYAVIADIVGSRTLTNRAEAQRIFEAALERAAEGLGLLEAPYPTVGDEFQAVAYSGEGTSLQDGSAWWAARAAINRAHDVQDSSNPFIRTWFVAHASVETYVSSSCQTVVNALLSLRDHAILKLSARHRRITASLLLGKTQVEIARVEKLSQQAISDFARGTGAGLIQSSLLIAEATRA